MTTPPKIGALVTLVNPDLVTAVAFRKADNKIAYYAELHPTTTYKVISTEADFGSGEAVRIRPVSDDYWIKEYPPDHQYQSTFHGFITNCWVPIKCLRPTNFKLKKEKK